MAQQLKTCTTCKEDKTLDQFSKASRRPDGLQTSCKACNKIANAKFREQRPRYQKNYYRTDNGHKAKLEAQKRFWEKDGGGIYILVNKVNNKVYIGQTSQFKRREVEWGMYTRNPKFFSKYMNERLKMEVESFGVDSFEWMILEPMPDSTLKQRRAMENKFIDAFSKITEVYNKNKNK